MPHSTFTSRFPTRIHRLDVGPRTIDLVAPVDPDALLDDGVIEDRYKVDNYLPYWPIIWPSGLMLAEKILTDGTAPPDCPPDVAGPPRAIELGCGLGLAGIAAGLRGWHVTFTDYDPEAAEFAAHNAQRNGMAADRIRAMQMDWRACIAETFPWVIASDVLYERRLHELVLVAIKTLLATGGVAWVSDPNRPSAEDFPIAAMDHGFRVSTVPMQGNNFAGEPQAGNLYVLSRAK